MTPKRILITNCIISERSGTELYVRDLATNLLKRGHHPMVWSPLLGELADEFRLAGIPIFDTLHPEMPEPDVLHCHHHDETVAALSRFPERAGLFVLHDAESWHDQPPVHPRLIRHLAVDELCRERLVANGIPAGNTAVIANSVDLSRFRQGKELPTRPRRALAFGNYGGSDTFLPVLQEACDRAGLSLDVAGARVGKVANSPEQLLVGYDIVFAKGRSALEAIAVGAAVIVLDVRGIAGMVSLEDVARWRKWNFGRALLSTPHSVEAICEEIARYDPADAARCTDYVRANCSVDQMVESLLTEYDQLEKSWEQRAPTNDLRVESRTFSSSLALIGPLRDSGFQQQAEVAALRAANGGLSAQVAELGAANGALSAQAAELAAYKGEILLARLRTSRLWRLRSHITSGVSRK